MPIPWTRAFIRMHTRAPYSAASKTRGELVQFGVKRVRRLTADGVVEPKAKRQQVSKGSEKPAQDAGGDGKDEQKVPAVEEGTIYFLYRPRVGFEEVQSLSDVQRFYLVGAPWLVLLACHDRECLRVNFLINSMQMHSAHSFSRAFLCPALTINHIITFVLHAGKTSQVI